METLLILNLGSTSTKLAIYESETQVFLENIAHERQEILECKTICDQFPLRFEAVKSAIQKSGYSDKKFSAVISRGGSTKPLKHPGGYQINLKMVTDLRERPASQHAGNIGPMIAYEIAQEQGIKAYIYDSVAVDELTEIARISGLADIERVSLVHVLNSRYVAKETAGELGKKYENLSFIVAHIGGGITIMLHEKGRITDVVGDDEGPFSPERSGGIPTRQLVDLCYSGKYEDKNSMQTAMRGRGGLMSYLGTADVRETEARIKDGDERARLIYEAMFYQLAKGIAQLSVVTNGQIDGIILTGAIAHSSQAVKLISDRVSFIAPVYVKPGENEMKSLCLGGLSILRGTEKTHIYS